MTPTRKETMSIKIMMLIRSDVCDVCLFVCFFVQLIHLLYMSIIQTICSIRFTTSYRVKLQLNIHFLYSQVSYFRGDLQDKICCYIQVILLP